MKKIFLAMLITASFVACNDSATTTEAKKDSIENKTDSIQDKIQTNADSAINKVEAKSDSLKKMVDSTKK